LRQVPFEFTGPAAFPLRVCRKIDFSV